VTTTIGIVGCGFIARLHSRALKGVVKAGHADADVVAVCDLDRGRAEAFARAWSADVVDDPEEVATAVDAVWVCTPTSSHRVLVETAAAAGTAVFCEKPLAPTLVDAEAMAVAASSVPNQVGLVLRTSAPYAAAADLVHGGGLGRPMAAVFRDDQYFPNQGQYGSAWRADVTVAGGGTLLEHSIHDLDVLRWLLGDVESVSARTAGFAGHPGVEDVAMATLTFTSGATATLASVWHQVLSRPSTRHLEVFCEKGIVAVGDEYTGPVVLTTDGGVEERACPEPAWVRELPIDEPWRTYAGHYAQQARSFLASLAAGTPPWPDLDVAVAAHRVADAVYRSAAAGGSVVGVPRWRSP
jgi:predicted dehydrogenase